MILLSSKSFSFTKFVFKVSSNEHVCAADMLLKCVHKICSFLKKVSCEVVTGLHIQKDYRKSKVKVFVLVSIKNPSSYSLLQPNVGKPNFHWPWQFIFNVYFVQHFIFLTKVNIIFLYAQSWNLEYKINIEPPFRLLLNITLLNNV